MMLVSALTINAFAFENGETVSFTGTQDGRATVQNGFIGSCAWLGVPMESPGTGTVTKIPNSSTIAKALYYYAIQQGYDTEPLADEPMNPGWEMTKFGFLTDLTQIYGMGYDRWRAKFITMASAGAEGAAEYVKEKYDAAESLPVPPSSFEVYHLIANEGYQDLVIWRYTPEGSLRIVKNLQSGANRSFTFRVTVAGANGTYSGVTFTNGVAIVTVTSGNRLTISGLPAGAAYTVEEINIPDGYDLVSKTGDTGSIEGGDTKVATFTNKTLTGKIKLKKASSNTSITG